jgi:hypothetical protein
MEEKAATLRAEAGVHTASPSQLEGFRVQGLGFTIERERDASACIRRHQAFALALV